MVRVLLSEIRTFEDICQTDLVTGATASVLGSTFNLVSTARLTRSSRWIVFFM